MNQEQAVLLYLQKGHTITNAEAMERFGITRLGSVIHELRRKGHEIDMEPVMGKDRFGGKVRFARYSMKNML